MERKVIGIDFGSSQSSVSIMEIGSTGVPELLNVGGGRNGVTIPTLLALDANDDSVIDYGNNVRKHYREEKSGSVKFASNFKRYLGRTPSPDANDSEKNANLYSRLFLKELASFVKNRFNVKELDPKDYVTCVAHPATWDERQIALLKKYVADAGFPVDPDMGIYSVEEPVAAMHTLKIQQSLNFRFGNRPEHYMVIDFGGGTLDICVIKTDILGRTPKIISTSGDPTLGGRDFDEIIEHLFFRNNEGIAKSDLSNREIAELNEKFKEAKEAFSENFANGDVWTQPFHIARGQYSLTVSKQEFSNICIDRQIFEKIKKSIREALAKAKIDVSTIKKVILTGGSSKWFFLREIVAKEFSLGGDSIFNTEQPFTDVANGCAIKIGRPDAPPEKRGVWVRYKVDGDKVWSAPKCILKPARSIPTDEESLYIGTILGTQYVKPYRIVLSWWTGFEENNLEKSEDEAIIEFYARSNVPFLDSIKGTIRALRHLSYDPIPDEYKIYLQYREDEAGGKKYRFEILDSAASIKEKKRLALRSMVSGEKDKVDYDNLPDGYKEVGDILPGYISFRAIGGLKVRKLMQLKKGE